MDKRIWISNIEIYEFCKLDLETGEKHFYKEYSKSTHFLHYLNLIKDPKYILRVMNIN